MFCRELKVDEFVEGCTTEMGFQPGVKYLIIDAGGNTSFYNKHLKENYIVFFIKKVMGILCTVAFTC